MAADEHEYDEHEHDHDDDGHEHDHEHGPPPFEGIVAWLAEQSATALQEEGEHASVVFLGFPDGRVRAQQFEATGPDDVAGAWSRVATWAKAVGADAVYFVGEARREDEDTGEEEDVLFFSALNSEGQEAAFETPFTRDEEGRITLGEIQPASAAGVHFNEFRELWGLPLLGVDEDGAEGDGDQAA